jgi:hypothetical protein
VICAARRQHPSWGPAQARGLAAGPRYPAVDWPAVSTVGDLLARRGLVKKPAAPAALISIRRRAGRPRRQPNDLWTADFKGHLPHARRDLLLSAGRSPTSTPAISSRATACSRQRDTGCARSSIACFASMACRARFVRTTGLPFATCGIHGLSQLNVWGAALGHSAPADPPWLASAERRA